MAAEFEGVDAGEIVWWMMVFGAGIRCWRIGSRAVSLCG